MGNLKPLKVINTTNQSGLSHGMKTCIVNGTKFTYYEKYNSLVYLDTRKYANVYQAIQVPTGIGALLLVFVMPGTFFILLCLGYGAYALLPLLTGTYNDRILPQHARRIHAAIRELDVPLTATCGQHWEQKGGREIVLQECGYRQGEHNDYDGK